MAKLDDLSDFCIYTIHNSTELDTICQSNGVGMFVENKRWVEGRRLYLDAKHKGLKMPVILSAAEEISGLRYYAILTDVVNNAGDRSTTYRFTGLTRIKEEPPLSTLILKSTGKPLSNAYIRTYVICHTPQFLR